ncbi:MAG: Gfo/Idh/MocA family oxidoreductase [Chloroflexi bacterium]|nr:Gfo/Idh/MocA family oxidoreductase [Chloroflexota bacterium]
MEQMKVGVIGVGRMGQRHCRVYSNLRRAQLAGVYDVNAKMAEQVAGQYEVPSFSDLNDLLKYVDAVSLTASTPFHCELAMKCLERGVHVLIEKPIAETLEQAESLVETAEASGHVVLVGHIERFNPAYVELKNVLDGMNVLAVNLRRLSPYEGSNTDVDVVLDLMIHDTNLVLDLIGHDPLAVNAYGLSAHDNALDHVVANLTFDSGPLMTMTASRVTEQKIRSIEVTAMQAYLECDLLNKSISVHRRTVGEYVAHNKYRQESVVERIQVPIFEPLFMELQHFAECVLDGKKPMVSARDGLRALKLVDAIRNSVQERLAA